MKHKIQWKYSAAAAACLSSQNTLQPSLSFLSFFPFYLELLPLEGAAAAAVDSLAFFASALGWLLLGTCWDY